MSTPAFLRIKNVISKDSTISETDAYLDLVISEAMISVANACNFEIFPDMRKGYFQSATTNTADITTITDATFEISVDGSSFEEVEITVDGLDTGVKIASAMQTAIRALFTDPDSTTYWTFQRVTVEFDNDPIDSLYFHVADDAAEPDNLHDTAIKWDSNAGIGFFRFTSGSFGNNSNIIIRSNGSAIATALSLDIYYGSEIINGSIAIPSLEFVAADLARRAIRNKQTSGIGIKSKKVGDMSISYEGSTSSSMFTPNETTVINNNKRLTRG